LRLRLPPPADALRLRDFGVELRRFELVEFEREFERDFGVLERPAAEADGVRDLDAVR
jgi:hypothetical protein